MWREPGCLEGFSGAAGWLVGCLPSAFTCWLSTCRLSHLWHPAQTLSHVGLPKCSVELCRVSPFQNMLNRRSFSDVLPESPKSARKKEEARQAEFVRIGQVGPIPAPLSEDVQL